MKNDTVLLTTYNDYISGSNPVVKNIDGGFISRVIARGLLALSILLLVPVSVFCIDNDPDLIKIGVLAKRGQERCLEKWKPTAEYLTNEIPGHSFTIIPLGFDKIYSSVKHKEVDFILANSSFYVGLELLHGVNRIATIKELYFGKIYCDFGGVIFYRADRKDIDRPDDLRGKSFMGVEEASFGGWQTAWRELKEHGIDPYRDFSDLSFGGTHDAVVYAVRDGKVDAGTVRTGTLERMELEGKISLDDFRTIPQNHSYHDHCSFSLLHSTYLYPEWPFAKTAHISDELAEEVALTLMKMSPDNPAAKAARCAGWTIPHNYQPVHECLKELRAGPYKDYGKVSLHDILWQYWPWLLATFFLGISILLMAIYMVRLNRKLGNEIVEREKELTERKRAEEALRESEEKHRELLANLPQKIFHKDTNSVYVSCNENYANDLRIASHEIRGKTDFDFYPRELAEKYRMDDQRLIKSGQTEEIEESYIKDGQEFFVQTVKTPQTDDAGNVTGILGIFWDITERKQIEEDQKKLTELLMNSNNKLEDALVEREKAEKILSETVDRYTAMINTVPALMFIKDIGDKYIEVNEAFCRFVAKSKDKIIGKDTREVHSKELAEKFYTEDKSVMDNNKEIINREEQYFDDDGNIKWISSSRIPLHDDDGKVSGLVGLAQDITKQHLNHQQLMQSDKLAGIGQLAAGVAHEINNPIGYINSNLNTMTRYLNKIDDYIGNMNKQGAEELEDIKEMLTDFNDAVGESIEGTNKVRDIVADLKSFSRVDRAKKEHADINEGIKTTLNVVWNEIKYKAEVKKEFGEIPELYCMPNQLNQVFMNLLVNAAHAIEKDMGLITIKTWADDGNIYISVADDGVGIPEENIKKLFEPFFTTKDVGKGTGLGLSLSYDIIKKHKGFINVKSEVGVGTEFTITLPLEGISEKETQTVTC